MLMTLNSTLNSQQHKQESITSSVSLSQLKQNLVETGRKCTNCGKSEPEVKFTMTRNTWGTKFKRPRCNSCYAQGKLAQNTAVRREFGPGEPRKLIRENRPPEGTICPGCGEPMSHGTASNSVNFDHDPETWTFRGWICRRCNNGLGSCGDTIESLERKLKYLYEALDRRRLHSL